MTSFDDPKPPEDKRRQQIIYLRPSLKEWIDGQRAIAGQSRSEFIERLIRETMEHRQKYTDDTAIAVREALAARKGE